MLIDLIFIYTNVYTNNYDSLPFHRTLVHSWSYEIARASGDELEYVKGEIIGLRLTGLYL